MKELTKLSWPDAIALAAALLALVVLGVNVARVIAERL